MASDIPVHLDILIDHRGPIGSCTYGSFDVDTELRCRSYRWPTTSRKSDCICPRCIKYYPAQITHTQDWIVANSVSHRVRKWAKESFFREKLFIVDAALLNDIIVGRAQQLSQSNRQMFLQYATRVVAPVDRVPRDLLTLPRYCAFQRLRSLDTWMNCGGSHGQLHYPSSRWEQRHPEPGFRALLSDTGIAANIEVCIVQPINPSRSCTAVGLFPEDWNYWCNERNLRLLRWVADRKEDGKEVEEDTSTG